MLEAGEPPLAVRKDLVMSQPSSKMAAAEVKRCGVENNDNLHAKGEGQKGL